MGVTEEEINFALKHGIKMPKSEVAETGIYCPFCGAVGVKNGFCVECGAKVTEYSSCHVDPNS